MLTPRDLFASLAFAALPFLAAGCVPHRDLPPAQIETLTKLSDVMDVQATISDPQFKKAGQASYTAEDWAAFADMGNRLQVTSRKAHQFTTGPGFDKLADQLNQQAAALSAAAEKKDAGTASGTLTAIKATCKECHHKYR